MTASSSIRAAAAARLAATAILLATVLAPGSLGALPPAERLASGLLLDRSEDASYDLAPDGSVVPRAGMLSLYPDGAEPLWPSVDAAASTVQGRLCTVLVALGSPLVELHAEVRLATGQPVVSGRGFELPASVYAPPEASGGGAPADAAGASAVTEAAPPVPEALVYVYALLFTVPLESGPALCTLEVSGSDEVRRFSFTAPLEVLPAETMETRIALDATLTAIRTRSDARTTREQERLNEVMYAFVPSAVYDLEAMSRPLPGAVGSAGFGDRRVYEYSGGGTAGSTHRGIDLVAATGTPASACARGRVVLAEDLVVTGNTVAVEHLPGLLSFYFHLSAIGVSVGQIVERGESVGQVGATGLATGPHLHWEIRCRGVPTDPRSVTEQPLVDKPAIFRIIVAYRAQDRRR